MDLFPVYPGAIPLDTDLLNPQRSAEIALGFVMRAAFGTGTVIDGLAVAQQASPNMTVQVGPGSIIFNTTVDTVASGFGSLTYDGSTPLVKIGVNTQPVNMSALTAPGTAGTSQNWLVEAQFLEADGTPVVLPYYDSANPALPYTGPANAGTTNNTKRAQTVQLQWKGGTAATTGQQNTPTPDAGWVGVAVVTIANGQSSILNANITSYSAAPFVPTKLAFLRKQLTANLTIYCSPFGSDTANSGLSASSPYLTIQKAWNALVSSYDLNGFTATIQLANGTYAGFTTSSMPVGANNGASSVTILGNTGSPSSVVVTSSSGGGTVNLSNLTLLTLSGVTIQSTGSGVAGVLANFGSTVTVGAGVAFGACTGPHLWAGTGAVINVTANYTINGGATIHWYAGNGTINASGFTITLTGTPAFSTAFAQATNCGTVTCASDTFSGSATGQRFNSAQNAVISCGGVATYLPGSIAGGTSNGGIYV